VDTSTTMSGLMGRITDLPPAVRTSDFAIVFSGSG
jgi:hypothetical protein